MSNPTQRLRRRVRNTDFPADREDCGGARRDRTDDLMLAKHALYQLSYGPRERVPRNVDPVRLEDW